LPDAWVLARLLYYSIKYFKSKSIPCSQSHSFQKIDLKMNAEVGENLFRLSYPARMTFSGLAKIWSLQF
jgi:hypothetical protein